jgi:TetR/AcrR family transcriptional regulator, cholesterol catabolism regulator
LARKPADQSVNRDDIILAAADVLRRAGYEAATMKDIAAAVNLTAASLYHHFKNKDTLLLAVLEAGLEYVISQTEAVVELDAPYESKVRALVREHIRGLTDNTAVGAAMVFEIRSLMNVNQPLPSATQTERDAHRAFLARRDAFFSRRDYFEELFRRVIREGIESGVFRRVDVPIFVKTMLGAHNWVGVWYRPDGRLVGGEIADIMSETFLRSLKP